MTAAMVFMSIALAFEQAASEPTANKAIKAAATNLKTFDISVTFRLA
jgi:hypothetical protein